MKEWMKTRWNELNKTVKDHKEDGGRHEGVDEDRVE